MNPVDLDLDPDEARLHNLTAWARREADLLDAVIPAVSDAQWSPAPIDRPRIDTAERIKGLASDPTATVALDSARLDLRAQVVRSERVLRDAIVALRGVRRGLERALAPWSREGHR